MSCFGFALGVGGVAGLGFRVSGLSFGGLSFLVISRSWHPQPETLKAF